ncbi:MAG: oxidoreductase [Lentisphaerae bacterium GWF2_52_8]|nr:MAG: oxidoreductase [Lentisphaerae bacterium GWF2_52_8]
MAQKKLKIGIIGCGNISQAYFNGLKMFPNAVEVCACADLNMQAAEAKAQENGVKAISVDNLLADSSIDMVINLTIPKVHAEVALRALEAGKHVHSEKPFAVTREDGQKVLALAKKKKLRVGCAPDTFMGAGLQTSRKIIDDGWIGRPVGGTAFMMGRGPEAWHPNPFFFYETGGGPMFDMGPYYVTALVHLLGPVKRVAAITAISFKERIAGSKEHFGKKIPVKVPTHLAGTLEFQQGAVVTLVTSFDVYAHKHPPIQIFGSDGSVSVPDPNSFGGPVSVFRPGASEWKEVPLVNPYHENSRGIGAADMAYGLKSGRPHRCSGELAYHVLDVMHSFEESSKSGKIVTLKSCCVQPAAMPLGLMKGLLDE